MSLSIVMLLNSNARNYIRWVKELSANQEPGAKTVCKEVIGLCNKQKEPSAMQAALLFAQMALKFCAGF